MSSFIPISNDVVIPPNGEVNLTDKQIPICNIANDDLDDHYAYTRGIVDVAAFKAYLHSLPEVYYHHHHHHHHHHNHTFTTTIIIVIPILPPSPPSPLLPPLLLLLLLLLGCLGNRRTEG